LNEIVEYGKDGNNRSKFKLNDKGYEVSQIIMATRVNLQVYSHSLPPLQNYGTYLMNAIGLFQSSYVLEEGKKQVHNFNRNLSNDGITNKNVILALDEALVNEWTYKGKMIYIKVVRKSGYSDTYIGDVLKKHNAYANRLLEDHNATVSKDLTRDYAKLKMEAPQPLTEERLRRSIILEKGKHNKEKTQAPQSLLDLEEALKGTMSELTVEDEKRRPIEIDGAPFKADIFEEKGYSTETANQDLRIETGIYNLKWHDSKKYAGRLNVYNDKVSQSRSILIHSAYGSRDPHRDSAGCLLIGDKIEATADKQFVGANTHIVTSGKNGGQKKLDDLERIVHKYGVVEKDGKGDEKTGGKIYNALLIIVDRLPSPIIKEQAQDNNATNAIAQSIQGVQDVNQSR
jgi:hypothetical protein